MQSATFCFVTIDGIMYSAILCVFETLNMYAVFLQRDRLDNVPIVWSDDAEAIMVGFHHPYGVYHQRWAGYLEINHHFLALTFCAYWQKSARFFLMSEDV